MVGVVEGGRRGGYEVSGGGGLLPGVLYLCGFYGGLNSIGLVLWNGHFNPNGELLGSSNYICSRCIGIGTTRLWRTGIPKHAMWGLEG